MDSGALRCGDRAHGVMEAQPEHLGEEVDGVACQIPFRPAPVAVFEDQARMRRQLEVAGVAFAELEAAFLQERNERCQSGGADLFAGPARGGRAR